MEIQNMRGKKAKINLKSPIIGAINLLQLYIPNIKRSEDFLFVFVQCFFMEFLRFCMIENFMKIWKMMKSLS